MSRKTLRASEIGEFAFCQRAWWYRRLGFQSLNEGRQRVGTLRHRRHGREVLLAGCLRALGYALLLLAVVVAAAYLTNLALR